MGVLVSGVNAYFQPRKPIFTIPLMRLGTQPSLNIQ
jgi:hypothetical protein